MQKKNKAFTLMELLVGISIISIILIGVSNINFNSSTNKQKLEIFNNYISAEIEEVRNNALIGKGIGIGTTLTIPEKWKIDFSLNNSGSVITSHYDGSDRTPYKTLNIQSGNSISNIKCIDISGSDTDLTGTGTGTIEFKGGEYDLKNNCFSYSSIEIETSFKGLNKTINFDSVNGLIKK